MPDHFAILSQARRPCGDKEALKEAFHRATAQAHPDVAGGSGDKAAALNSAYEILREPAARLRHLIELEWPDAVPAPAGIGPDLTALFGLISDLQQTAAALRNKEQLAQSPLGRALLAGEQAAYRRALEAALAALARVEIATREELRALDAVWDQRDEETCAHLVRVQQRFAVLGKWQAHLREELFRVAG